MNDRSAAPVPAFVREVFSDESLIGSRSALLALSPTGTILWVNECWWELARAHGAEAELARFGPGASYFDGMTAPLRAHYEAALSDALRTRRPYEETYECSTSAAFCLFRLRALPVRDHGLLLEHSLAVEVPRFADAAGPYRDEHGFVRQCSNCRRVRRASDGAWDFVGAVAAHLLPDVSHGICPTCADFYWSRLLRAAR